MLKSTQIWEEVTAALNAAVVLRRIKAQYQTFRLCYPAEVR